MQRSINIVENMIYTPANIFQAGEPKSSASSNPLEPLPLALNLWSSKARKGRHGFIINHHALSMCHLKRGVYYHREHSEPVLLGALRTTWANRAEI